MTIITAAFMSLLIILEFGSFLTVNSIIFINILLYRRNTNCNGF